MSFESPGRSTRFDGEAAVTPSDRYRVSVIIPVRNEEHSIGGLLEDLRAQTRQADEIVICDAGSTDTTGQAIRGFIERGMPIKLITTGPAFPGRARNLATQAASFETIVMTCARTSLPCQWLASLVAPFDEVSPPDVVYGRYEPVRGTFCQRCIALSFVPVRDRRIGVRSIAMRRAIWRDVGGFREDLRAAEDLVFFRNIEGRGFSTRIEPTALVFYDSPRSLKETLSRFAAYSHSNIQAGLAREWQVPLLRIYLLMALLSATVLWTPFGALAPLGVVAARAVKRIVREMGVLSILNVPLVLGVIVATLTLDLATFRGCWRWLIGDWIRSKPPLGMKT